MIEALGGVQLSGECSFRCDFPLFCWENGLSSNASSNITEAWNSGTPQQLNATSARWWMAQTPEPMC